MASTSGWGQSDNFRMVNTGWGNSGDVNDSRIDREFTQSQEYQRSSYSSQENYSGPIETWSNYKAITPGDWATFKEHMVVYSDGSNPEGVEAGWLVCMLCTSKKAQSKDLMHAHILSMKHQRNFDWIRHVPEKERSAPVAYYDMPPLSAEDQAILKEHRLSVVDGWIQCTLCMKKFMDMSFVPEHIRTTKHLNNLDWAREESCTSKPLPVGIESRNFGEFFCASCGVTMSSRVIMDAHVASVRHLRNEQTSQRVERSGVTIADLIDFDDPPEHITSKQVLLPSPPMKHLPPPLSRPANIQQIVPPISRPGNMQLSPPPSSRPDVGNMQQIPPPASRPDVGNMQQIPPPASRPDVGNMQQIPPPSSRPDFGNMQQIPPPVSRPDIGHQQQISPCLSRSEMMSSQPILPPPPSNRPEMSNQQQISPRLNRSVMSNQQQIPPPSSRPEMSNQQMPSMNSQQRVPPSRQAPQFADLIDI